MTLEAALAMAIAIPSAVNDTIELLRKIIKRSNQESKISEEELNNILDRAQEIRQAVRGFTHVTADLRPWKHAHHCTNQIIHKEMKALFSYDIEQISDRMDKNPKSIAAELRKSFHGSDASFIFIRSKDFSELDLDLPEGIKSLLDGKTWYAFILDCGDVLSDHLRYQNVDNFFSTLYKYNLVVTILNEAADKRLLRGLDLISDRLDQVRSMLSSGGGSDQ
ncbi:hypothetical protein [Siccirubricoccus phaeus]|uniref:hypothetical protein n=1 Tax=Siccirubricoccus phaeus TaxID=2595053 RepID=UPI0011F3A682|nr:hypothetical protein [Siccirubricoccus phaeus]